jgi:ATP-dependent exoDNAse (exonuclease V) beta subunit
MTLVDADARARIRADLTSTLVVEAAAGTGKTTELVARILSLLTSGTTTLGRIVAVTFTEKAAGEMKLRLRAEIERAREAAAARPEERARLDLSLAELETARIGTIHGFCADLLRERPVEAGIDPLFEVAAGDETERLLDACFDAFFQRALAAPPPGIGRVLRRRSNRRDAVGPRDELRRAALSLIEQRDYDAPWSTPAGFAREAELDLRFEELRDLAKLATESDNKESWLVKSLQEIGRVVSEIERRERVRGGERDHDGMEAELRELERQRLWGWRGSGKWFSKTRERANVIELREQTKQRLKRTLDLADAQLAAALQRELAEVVREFVRLKQRSGKLDFLDLLLVMRDLLRERVDVRTELQARYTHLLVDEFQDTDPLQAEILFLLAAADPAASTLEAAEPAPGKLFFVGDPKQSIYRFRRADVTFYEALKRRLVAGGASVLHLRTSFRAVPSIQSAVNAAFAAAMVGNDEGSQASYVALEAFREEPPGRPSVVALPVPRPYGDYGKIVSWRVDESFPDAVGAFVDWLSTKSGWTIRERGEDVPIEPRHVCLLFKRLQNFGQDVTRPYVKALEARRIPHVLVGGRSYHAREEILAVRNALTAIEWPDDELSVFATLRGPLFAIQDDALLAYRHRHGSILSFRQVASGELDAITEPVQKALSILFELHRRRNRRPIADTLAALLEETRAHAGIASWPTGEQALANVLRVLDLARRFEASGATSFRAFVTKLLEDAERGGAAEAPVVEEGTEGVRLMTVHRAKGLEFPVVILCDPTAPRAQRNPSRFVDAAKRLWAMPLVGCAPLELVDGRETALRHDEEESTRLLYVATTRAREILVLPVCGDEELEDTWLEALRPVVHPRSDTARRAEPAPGCPAFGRDSVRERPDNASTGAQSSVMPGLHRPRAGTHGVTWWDPNVLELDREHDGGLRQQRMLAADAAGKADDAGERMHAEWQAARLAVLAKGAVPSVRVETPTDRKDASGGSGAASPDVERTGAAREGRPRGKRFGILVHAALAVIELDADPAAVARVVDVQRRLVGASLEEANAAERAVVAALEHPLFARARASADVRRECSIEQVDDSGAFVRGVLDLAFREDGRWTVVDFKTDVELDGRLEAYGAQLEAYVAAVAAATGEAATGVLLSV